MDYSPDYKLIEDVKCRLKNTHAVRFELHGEERIQSRSLSKTEIENALRNPINLVHAEVQEDLRGEKYKLVFEKSRKYDLIVVIRFANSDLKIRTAYLQNRKRAKISEKLRKMLSRQ